MNGAKQARTEELVDVSAEAVDVPVRGDEGNRLPVGVGARPEVPGVAGDADARVDLGADGLNAVAGRSLEESALRKDRAYVPSLAGEPDHAVWGRCYC